MEIRTGEEIAHEVLNEYSSALVNGFEEGTTKATEDNYVSVKELTQHIKNSCSPDGDYPDADCIITDLQELVKKSKG